MINFYPLVSTMTLNLKSPRTEYLRHETNFGYSRCVACDERRFKVDHLKQVPAWLERCLARPAVQRGLEIPKRG